MTGQYVAEWQVWIGGELFATWGSEEGANWSAEGMSLYRDDVVIVKVLTWAPIMDLSQGKELEQQIMKTAKRIRAGEYGANCTDIIDFLDGAGELVATVEKIDYPYYMVVGTPNSVMDTPWRVIRPGQGRSEADYFPTKGAAVKFAAGLQ